MLIIWNNSLGAVPLETLVSTGTVGITCWDFHNEWLLGLQDIDQIGFYFVVSGGETYTFFKYINLVFKIIAIEHLCLIWQAVRFYINVYSLLLFPKTIPFLVSLDSS